MVSQHRRKVSNRFWKVWFLFKNKKLRRYSKKNNATGGWLTLLKKLSEASSSALQEKTDEK